MVLILQFLSFTLTMWVQASSKSCISWTILSTSNHGLRPFVHFQTKIYPKMYLLYYLVRSFSMKGSVNVTWPDLAVLVRYLKLVATICTLEKSLLWPFSWGFSCISTIWRAIVWINGAIFGIYTEENILLTEPRSLKRLLIFPVLLKNSVVMSPIKETYS